VTYLLLLLREKGFHSHKEALREADGQGQIKELFQELFKQGLPEDAQANLQNEVC
jgi:hypothetical protein